MKYIIAAAAALAVFTGAVPASAQPYHPYEHGNYEYRYHQAPHGRYFAPPRRYAEYRHYREGEYWRGHRLAWRNGRWGYYQPNGFFFRINL